MIEIDNITEARLLSNLKADFTASKLLRNELDQKIARWKREYNAEPYGNEVNGRSKLVSRDIKKQSEWQHAALIEPFVSTPDIIKANPVTSEDAEIAPKIEVLLNTQFCRQFSRYNFMTKALKVLDQEGTVVIRTGWEYEEKVVEVEEDREIPNPDYQRAIEAINQGITDPSILQGIEPTLITKVRVRKTKPVKNHPTAMVCRNEDIFVDPTCQDDMDKCQFVIYRYETDMTTLKQAGIYKNLDKIKIPTGLTGTNDTEYITEDSTSFRFSDTARKKIVVHEYWGNYDINGDDIAEPIVCTWIDNTIIRLEDNPFPDKKPPFLIVPFSAIPFKLYGESNAELLSDIQKIKTAIYRGFIDNMALSNNGQKGIKKGSLDEYNKQRFLNGENFEFNHYASDFFIGNFNELPSSIFNVLTLMNNEAESITGVASFNTGINGNALGSTATSIRGAIDSASTRRLNIVRNISENLVKPLLRKWLAYDAMFLDEESQYRITNDTFVYLKRDDLGANIDIDLSISTSDDNRAKAQELAFVLQTVGPSEDPRLRKILMAQIAQLYRMPDLAKMIMDYKPEPDPMAEQMQRLQMQLLQAEIANTQAKAGENTVDQDVKRAKIQTELAKAKNLNSMADKTDLDYVHQYSGIKEKEALQRQQLQNQFNIDRETLKLLQSPKQQYL